MPTLREAQNFFYHLMARPEVIGQLKRDRAKTLRRYFREARDRDVLMHVPLERLETYRKHVSIGFLGGIESAFPVLRSLVNQTEWNDLLNEFYLKKLTRSPIARHVFREFSHYLQKAYRGPLLKRLPYLKELAEYENLDLRILYEIDKPVEGPLIKNWRRELKNPESVLAMIPVLNPHHALRTYLWPVHRITRGYSSKKQVRPGRYSLLVYRDPNSLDVRFMETNDLVAQVVSATAKGNKSLSNILNRLIQVHHPKDTAAFAREAMVTLDWLAEKGVVLGFKNNDH